MPARLISDEAANLKALAEQIADIDGVEIFGRVVGVRGLMVEIAGPIHAMSVGGRLTIETAVGLPIPCEVVGFAGGHALAMPFAALEGVRRGCRAIVNSASAAFARRSAGSAGSSTPWACRLMGRGRCRRGQRLIPSAIRRRRRMPVCGWANARSRRARSQYLPDGLPGPAHGHLLRLRRRQVAAAIDARP